jgi:hypothetical protein
MAIKRLFLTGLTLIALHSLNSQTPAMAPEATEKWSPVPAVVKPGEGTKPPSDATVLLGEGADLSMWEGMDGAAVKWDFSGGVLTVVPKTGAIRTKNYFGDCQLHVEWRTPSVVKGEGQKRGNSGIFLMEKYEVQVLDSYNNVTYSNGQAASIYKQHAPLVNASLPPGEWQVYDIIWKAPVFNSDGSLQTPAYITVIHNGIVVQNHSEVLGESVYIGLPVYNAHPGRLPISLQDHGDLVSYRNIWIREL